MAPDKFGGCMDGTLGSADVQPDNKEATKLMNEDAAAVAGRH